MVNPAIAMGVKQLELPDPLAQYGKIAAIQQAQNQNALAQYQLGAAQRTEASENALNAAYQQSYDPQTGRIDVNKLRQTLATGGFGSKLPSVEKSLGELDAQRLTRVKTQLDFLPRVYQQAALSADPYAAAVAIHDKLHSNPDMGPWLSSMGASADQGLATIQAAAQKGPDAVRQLLLDSAGTVESIASRMKPMALAPSTTVYNPVTKKAEFTAPAAPEKPEGRTPTQKDYEYAVSRGYTGSFMDFQAAQRPPGTNVRVALPPQPKEEQEARGRLLVKGYETISDAARVAARSLPALETQERVLDAGFRTGFGAEAQTTAARVLSALGVENAKEYAKSSEAFSAAASQAVLQRQLEQKGVQTEADAQRISQTGAQLGNTPEGNKFIISVARAQFNRDIAQRNFYDSWWKKNGTYDGAEDAWFSGPGNKSLFESPELKQFAAPKPGKERPSLQSIFK